MLELCTFNLESEVVKTLRLERIKLETKHPDKTISLSKVANAHLKRSLAIPAEVKI